MYEQHENDPKHRFVTGASNRARVGNRGNTVHLEVINNNVRVRTTNPRKQMMIGTDTPEMRAKALRVAERLAGDDPLPPTASIVPVPPPPPTGSTAQLDLLTPRIIWESSFALTLGRLPEGILDWNEEKLLEFYAACSPHARANLPSFKTILLMLTAARRLDRDGILAFDRNLDMIEAGEVTTRLQGEVVGGGAPATMRKYFGLFRTAVRAFRQGYERRWAGRPDFTAKVVLPKKAPVQTPEIGEERAGLMLAELRRRKDWRAAAAFLIALASGRRIGAIGARTIGAQLDHPPLTGADFSRNREGKLEVTWRRNAAKRTRGKDQSDDVQACPRELEAAYRWLTRFHPNPISTDHPLIWDEADPTRGVSYDRLRKTFRRAWRHIFGEPPPKHLLWHAICRTTVTTIADAVGIEAAAEHTGRSVQVAATFYKRRRPATQAETAKMLTELRRKRRKS
jgi:hypothetical protein